MQFIYLTIAILYLCQFTRLCASAYLTDSDFQDNPLFEQLDKASFKRSEMDENGPEETSPETPSLDSLLNVRVFDESELCPRKNVIMFFTTGDIRYLSACRVPGDELEPDSQGQQHENQPSNPESSNNGMTSYSGRLLKRILQNMNNGLPNSAQAENDVDEGGHDKRGGPRLSINGALSSLADMLREGSRRYYHTPRYGFRQRLRTLG